LIVVTILAYFLLAHREAFLLKAVEAVPTFQDKRRVVDIAKEIQTSIARYLVSVTLLNLGLGLASVSASACSAWLTLSCGA
jgi:predicted PurR-regulated permease PerM